MCIITATAISTSLGVSMGVATALAVAANTAVGLGVVASIGGSVMGGVSSYQQGKAQEAQYNYQAQVAQENAKIAEDNAATERQQGIEEARLQRMKAIQAVGSQQTAMAANGVDVTQGTALDVIEDTAAMGELDALQTSYNYERKALAYEQQANNYQNQANLDIIAGQNAYQAGKMNGLASGLNGISKVGDVAYKWFDFSGIGNSGTNNNIQTVKSGTRFSGGLDSKFGA